MHALQAFVTREHLAVVTEHGPGGVLSDYILEHSSDVAGMGLQESVARCGHHLAPSDAAFLVNREKGRSRLLDKPSCKAGHRLRDKA